MREIVHRKFYFASLKRIVSICVLRWIGTSPNKLSLVFEYKEDTENFEKVLYCNVSYIHQYTECINEFKCILHKIRIYIHSLRSPC